MKAAVNASRILWVLSVGVLAVTAGNSFWQGLASVAVIAATGYTLGHAEARRAQAEQRLKQAMRQRQAWTTLQGKEVPGMSYYILKDRKVVAEPRYADWVAWMDGGLTQRLVAHTTFADDGVEEAGISTVFLGIGVEEDDTGRPLVFETMVFGTTLHGDTARYSTYAGAVAGHMVVTQTVKALLEAEKAHDPERLARQGRVDADMRRSANAHLN